VASTMCLCCSCSGMEPGRPALRSFYWLWTFLDIFGRRLPYVAMKRTVIPSYLCHLVPLKVAGKLDLGAAACSHYGTYCSDL